MGGASTPIRVCIKINISNRKKYKSYLLEFAALKFGLDKFSSVIWGFPVEREGILAYHIVDIRHIPGKLNMVADGISRKWENTPPRPGDGSEWTVSEDWEARTGLVNDIMTITAIDASVDALCTRFKKEPVFKEVIEVIYNLDQSKEIREK
jgi:hypothetical protein